MPPNPWDNDPIVQSAPRQGPPASIPGTPKPAAQPTPFQAEDQDFQRRKNARDEAEWNANHHKDGTKKTSAEKNPQAYSQSAMDAFDRAIESGDRLLKGRGGAAAIGSGWDPNAWGQFSINPWAKEDPITGTAVPGTPAASYLAQLHAMKAQVFLPMVQSMKGMGALSNAEGEKLTAAIGALSPNMEETEYTASLQRVIGDLKKYRARAEGVGQAAKPASTKRLKFNPATGKIE